MRWCDPSKGLCTSYRYLRFLLSNQNRPGTSCCCHWPDWSTCKDQVRMYNSLRKIFFMEMNDFLDKLSEQVHYQQPDLLYFISHSKSDNFCDGNGNSKTGNGNYTATVTITLTVIVPAGGHGLSSNQISSNAISPR